MSHITPNSCQNFITNGVKGIFETACTVSKFHRDKLFVGILDPDILFLYNRFYPLDDILVALQAKRKSSMGIRKGSTKTKRDLTKELVSIAPEVWQTAIKPIYAKGTVRYLELFPNDKNPFNRGKFQLRVEAVKTLLTTIGSDPLLAAIKVIIQEFYDAISGSQTAQTGKKQIIIVNSAEETTAMENMCNMHFRNYGLLVDKFSTSPVLIESYTDYASMRKAPTKEILTGIASAKKLKFVCQRIWKSRQKITIYNDGPVDFRIFLTDISKKDRPGTGRLVPAGDTVVLFIEELGMTSFKFMMVQNLNGTIQGHYTIDLAPVVTVSEVLAIEEEPIAETVIPIETPKEEEPPTDEPTTDLPLAS